MPEFHYVWCHPFARRARTAARGCLRDRSKLADWDAYLTTCRETPPAFAHAFIDTSPPDVGPSEEEFGAPGPAAARTALARAMQAHPPDDCFSFMELCLQAAAVVRCAALDLAPAAQPEAAVHGARQRWARVLLGAASGGGGGDGGSSGAGAPAAARQYYASLLDCLLQQRANVVRVARNHSARALQPDGSGAAVDIEHARVGLAFFPEAALLNHSCQPSARFEFLGARLSVVTSRALQPGEELTVSYGPLAALHASTRARQAALRAQYCFDCACIACVRPEAPLDFRCPMRAGCRGVLRLQRVGDPQPPLPGAAAGSGAARGAVCSECGPCGPAADALLQSRQRSLVAQLAACCKRTGPEVADVDGATLALDPGARPRLRLLEDCLLACRELYHPRALRLAEVLDALAREHTGMGAWAAAADCVAEAVCVLEQRFQDPEPELSSELGKLAQLRLAAAEEEVKRAGLPASAAADHVRSLAPLFARAAAALPPINVSSSDAVATFSQACARFRTLTGEGHQHAVR
jgi:hypothetical protein